MNYLEKDLNLSKNLNKLLNEEICKNGKNNLNNLLNNGFFLKKNILTEAAIEPVEGLLIKYRNFYYKNIAKKIYNQKITSYSGFSEVKIYNHSNTLQNPNYYFILSFKTGNTGTYSADTKVMLYNLPEQRYFYYEYDNSSVAKWKKPIRGYINLPSGGVEVGFYADSIDALVLSARTKEVRFGAEDFKMGNLPDSVDWSKSFLASKIFEDFDGYSESLLRAKNQVITKIT